MANSDEILAKAHKLHPVSIDLSLDRLIKLLDKLDNPHKKLPPIVHIAGTNGKGSTLSFIRAILQSHGKKIHAYTSPHLVRFSERIYLADQDISEQALVKILNEVMDANDGDAITFFEFTTAVAFLAFSQVNADYLLLEVGLGGRFDATNVIEKPILSIITPVSIDHTEYLGSDIEKIAYEKAGIIKQNTPVIVGVQCDDVFNVIENIAQKNNAKMISYGVEFQAFEQYGRLTFQDQMGLMDLPLPALLGAHQIQNASIAIAACDFLLEKFDETLLAQALIQVKWPARFERINSKSLASLSVKNAQIWLDGGHNAAGGIALAQQLLKLSQTDPRPLYLIVAMLDSKQAHEFLKPFIALNPKLFCLEIKGQNNSFTAEKLYQIANNVGLEASIANDFTDALKQIKLDCKAPPRILICGSLYQAGNILRYIEDNG